MPLSYKDIFQNDLDFNRIALEVFTFQYTNNQVYQKFCDLLHRNPKNTCQLNDIPFLPISFFKEYQIKTNNLNKEDIVFTSSGTTGSQTSKHYVQDIQWYIQSYVKGFEYFYNDPADYTFLALLPSYLEREGSSLIFMMEDLIQKGQPKSGFYLNNHQELIDSLHQLEAKNQKTILVGVTYALLDLIEKQNFQLKNTLIMETGGMKGKRKELIREELHEILCHGFGVEQIHSEYGMTELLSQAYSKGNGIFECPPWMKVMIRDTEDALSYLPNEKTGGINVIDLANINSCSFIATQDLGKKYNNETFEVLGRFDHSDIRGCNLMVI